MVTRRTLLTLPVAVAAAGLTTGVALASGMPHGASSTSVRAIPRTLARRRSLVAGRLRVAQAQQRLTHLALSGPATNMSVSVLVDGACFDVEHSLDAIQNYYVKNFPSLLQQGIRP